MTSTPTTIAAADLDDRPHEECGVVGVSGIEHAAEKVFLGLYALQHRGQESAGIVALSEDGAMVHKGLGLVADVFDAPKLAKLDGASAIGHVRYSTAGGSRIENAQPIVVRYSEGDLVIAHNGNLTNAIELRARLVEEGAIFQTSSDSEVIVHLIARSRHESVDGQIDDALTQLEGAFSLVMSVGDTIYAVRDPRGFRPLQLGRMDGGHVVASETCAFDIIGAQYIRDLDPGEVIKIQSGRVESLRSLPPAGRPSPCIFELVYFARPDSRLWGISVDRARRAFGQQLAREHPVEADAVVAVPDSANSAALGYAEESGIPFELGLLRNHYVGRTFIKPSQADRDFGARMKYNPVREVVAGKRVVVVDDSLVRGTTSKSLVKFMREAGAKEVHFRIASPPVRFPCFYGIDMPSREELIGARLTVEQIRAQLAVDSLGYLSLQGMETVVAAQGPFCNACFSGDYTAPLVDVEKGLAPSNVGPGVLRRDPEGVSRERLLALPKPELHVHLDGSLRSRTLADLARERGVALPTFDPEELARRMVADDAKSLEDYLLRFQLILSVLQDRAALDRVAYELAEDNALEGVRWLEVRYCPALNTKAGLSLEGAVEGALGGLARAEAVLPIRTGVILCAIRSHDPAESRAIAEVAVAYRDRGVVGFDLAGPERGFPAADHRDAFRTAAAGGVGITVHAGEAYGPESIEQALDDCGAQRIGHGTRLHQDPALLERVRAAGVPLEVCITSNVQTGAVAAAAAHPVRGYYDAGVRVTLNTDNRLISGTTVTDEYWLAHRELGFSWAELVEVARTGFRSAFLGPAEKAALLARVETELAGLDA